MKIDVRLGLIIGLVLALLALSAAIAGAQEIVVPEGDTLDIRIVTTTDTVRSTDTLTVVRVDTLRLTDTVTDTLVITDTLTVTRTDTLIVQLPPDTVFVGDTLPPIVGRLKLSDQAGVLTGQWTDIDGRTLTIRIGNNASAAPLLGSYWVCVVTSCNSQIMGAATPIGFRIPEPVPMEDGLMVQAVFPLADIRPITDYTATLNGTAGTHIPGGTDADGLAIPSIGWYWLPAPATGAILIDGPDETWSATYD